MNILITGGAGFIGRHLTDRFLAETHHKILILDNFSAARPESMMHYRDNKAVKVVRTDILTDNIISYFKNIDVVWHLAANADVRIGSDDTQIHVHQNIIATHNVLEAMRKNNVRKIIFTSSSTIYGNAERIPTPETYSPLEPVSLYGASKLASEALISAYCQTFGMQAWIFRLANIIGEGSRHGVIYDFIVKLNKNPESLEIFGDGEQKKSYLHVSDCIDAFFVGININGKLNIFNVGSLDAIKVKKIAEYVSIAMNLKPALKYTGGKLGWRGDVPNMQLDIKKLVSAGWSPKMDSEEATKRTIKELIDSYEI